MAIKTSFSRPRAIRYAALFVALASLLMLPGCWVYSVEPLYEDELLHRDKDVVFDPSIVGSWWHANPECSWTLTISAPPKDELVYELTMPPSPDCKSEEKDKKISRFDGRMVRLYDHRFLDISPKSADVCVHCLALHSILLISEEKDTLALTPVDGDWLKQAIDQKKVALTHLNDGTTLTASSKDLKDFVRKYATDETVFKPDPDLTFKRK